MDFFTKLGKKASKTYQITKEKAVNLSEELKLKGKMNDIKEKIDKIYIEIGKNVYNEIKDGKEVSKEEITVKCEDISKYKDEIEKIQLEILALKKVRKCVNCGEELNLDDSFCCKCGTKQPEIEKVEVKNEVAEDVKEAEVIEINDAENIKENSNNEENISDNVCENNNEANNDFENHEENKNNN